MVTDYITITELSTLTGKSRPTLYKYISAFAAEEVSDVPYAFVKLFELIESTKGKKSEIQKYCFQQFGVLSNVKPLVEFIQEHQAKIDAEKAIALLKKEFKL